MAKNKSKYIPKAINNPVIQARKLDELKSSLDKLGKTLKAVEESHSTHITYLGNFARHDIKNSIQSMDSIISTNNSDEINQEHLESLSKNLEVIRGTMDNFSNLVPHSQDDTFTLESLILGIEILNRSIFFEKKINFIKELPDNLDLKFKLPFQSVLQMLNNLIINSIKALEYTENPKIKFSAYIKDFVYLEIFDNGIEIDNLNSEKVFDFDFSTTGGSGIGLYHAKYICEIFEGKIELINTKKGDFTKSFLIYLPILKD
ncbi:ATP-binding protein [Aquirufa salirivi]|uniref:HAMP domain-containing sensor histidine kinase n=1 Tax=Aquirufa salirivi TaxID=3104729 RepID=A0ABW8RVR9_9BACT